MVEMRWVTRDATEHTGGEFYTTFPVNKMVLQMRQQTKSIYGMEVFHDWSEWQDIPVVEDET